MPRDCAAGEAGSCAAANEWNFVAIGEPDDFDHIRSGAREYHAFRPRHLNRAIVLIEQQILGLVQDGTRAQKLCQVVEKSRIHWRRAGELLGPRLRPL